MLLALDTSTRTVGVALYDGVQVVSEVMWHSRDFHTVELAPAVAEILEKSVLGPRDLQAIAVALGPGSFTGLRIGLALAKGLALARRLPIVGVPSLDILAFSQPVVHPYLAAVLRAGRGRLAVGWYQAVDHAWQASAAIELLTAAELNERIQAPTQVCGELDEEEQRLLARKRKNVALASPARAVRRPAMLAELGWQRWQAGQVDDVRALSPIYLHDKEPIPG